MKSLLWLSYYKIVPNRMFWLLLGGFWAVYFLALATLSGFSKFAGLGMQLAPLLQRPYVWGNLCWLGQMGHFILSFFLIMIVANDYEYGTLRKQVMDGVSRTGMLLHYFFLCLILAALSLLTVVVAGLLFSQPGLAGSGGWIDGHQLQVLLRFFLQGIAFYGFTLLVILLLKRSMPAVIFLTLWHLALEPILGVVLNHRVRDHLSDFLPLHAILAVIPAPHLPTLGITMGDSLSLVGIATAVVYMALFFVGCGMRLTYEDL